MKRQHLIPGAAAGGGGGLYFQPSPNPSCWSSGCCLLDCILGGGYALGRVVNVVGDKSTGKTLLAIEACTNFAQRFPKAKIRYREVEAAFDRRYASTLGLPLDRVEFPTGSCYTVEDVFADMEDFISKVRQRKGLYVLDSLDALSDRDELDGAFGKPSYGTAKAKAMSQLFRRLIQRLEGSTITVIIVSQVRANIGAAFGRKTMRSGGRALDFYASQVLWLSQVKRLTKTIGGITRPVGILVRALCDKNKVGVPFRECQFPIRFGYGIDDVAAALDWLVEVKRLDELHLKRGNLKEYYRRLRGLSPRDYREERNRLAARVVGVWNTIEQGFAPAHSKY